MSRFAIRGGKPVDPGGNPFLTLGVNHADETNLKYPRNIGIRRRKYGSRESWIRDGVTADLHDRGFNTLDWTQEYVSGGWGEALDWFATKASPTGNWTPTELDPHRTGCESHAARAEDYGAALEAVLDQPWFAGWHWCENTGRGRGLKDPWDEPYRDLTDPMTEHNRRAAAAYRKDV
ncbi:hypothetical protein [Pseudonocardia acidicola]|uniref:Uncharacterized protein n=1 Tax=Pseudonocardia acidicola TaxID=2724939 RepID=A0ABX1SE85_9PSEU|nr:hypothetical protein [Pseudonocardia acidicola]NMH98793.1 hypothetical protein [Pseudonocardia acidicola]